LIDHVENVDGTKSALDVASDLQLLDAGDEHRLQVRFDVGVRF
jgi:hypothetical protein